MPMMMRRFGIGILVVLCLFLVAFGALYASVSKMLFFHAAAVPEALRQGMLPLYLALMKLIGGASCALGLLGLYVTLGPLRAGARFAMTALTICIALPIVMAAYVAETLAAQTGAPTSGNIMGGLLAGLALAVLAVRFGAKGAS